MAAVSAAGTGVAVAGQLEQAAAAEKAAKFNEQVAQNNATQAMQAAQAEAAMVRRKHAATIGRANAVFAKNGLLMSGSAEDILYDSLIQSELDQMTAIYAGQVQSGYHQSQGMLARLQGESIKGALPYTISGELLRGAGRRIEIGAQAAQPYFED